MRNTGILAVATACLVSAPAAADIVFTESDFRDDRLVRFDLAINGARSTSLHKDSGGFPGECREIWNQMQDAPMGQRSAVISVHLLAGATYDPAVDGSIAKFRYQEHAYWRSGGGGLGQATGIAIRQADEVYVSLGLTTGQRREWRTLRGVFLVSDFHRVDTTDLVDLIDQGDHPDFSSSGGLMEIGFFRGNSTGVGGGGGTIVASIDNVVITVVPAPGAIGLFALAFLARSRRR